MGTESRWGAINGSREKKIKWPMLLTSLAAFLFFVFFRNGQIINTDASASVGLVMMGQ
jgi:hypothetical protein